MVKIGNIEVGAFPVALSPMDDITDYPFRELCKEFGADLLFTEFIASEALIRDAEKSKRKMLFTPRQHPLGIQIFGADEESMLRCVEVVATQQPDFIDINWGCPVRKVAGKGAGSGMLKDIPKLLKITEALVKRSPLPVTVKTRLGYEESNKPIVTLVEQLQDVGVAAVSIPGRTKTQMYSGVADWSLIGEAKNNPRLHIPIFGNGDLTTAQQVVEYKERYGVDGVLIGRGAIGNPWIFKQVHAALQGKAIETPSIRERCDVCRSHLLAAVAFKGERTALFEMRKHYGSYFGGIPHFKPFRMQLVSIASIEELLPIFDQIAETFADKE